MSLCNKKRIQCCYIVIVALGLNGLDHDHSIKLTYLHTHTLSRNIALAWALQSKACNTVHLWLWCHICSTATSFHPFQPLNPHDELIVIVVHRGEVGVLENNYMCWCHCVYKCTLKIISFLVYWLLLNRTYWALSLGADVVTLVLCGGKL